MLKDFVNEKAWIKGLLTTESNIFLIKGHWGSYLNKMEQEKSNAERKQNFYKRKKREYIESACSSLLSQTVESRSGLPPLRLLLWPYWLPFSFSNMSDLFPVSEPLYVLFPLPGMLFPLCREASQWALPYRFHLITTVISFLLPIPVGNRLLTCWLPRGLSPHENVSSSRARAFSVVSLPSPSP